MATVLDNLLNGFSVEAARDWLRQAFDSFDSSQSKMLSVDENKNDKKFFASARILGYIRELPESRENDTNHPVLVAVVEMKNDLTERTSRQTQFNFAKRTLQEAVRSGSAGLNGYPSQGIFFFYDKDQFFRISLVSAAVEGKRFKFNEAKRQSFYINPDRPNNVARSRLQGAIRTFADLKNAFSVETLTKEFYSRLFAWYEWAMKPGTGVSFPNVLGDPSDDRKYNNEAIIRLITRLMFTWFIRQRGLVPEACFTVGGVSHLLKDFKPQSMEVSNYYHCILQNLFFATLNCQPEKRVFRKRCGNNSHSTDWGIKTYYRYEKEFKSPTEFKQLMQQVPFLNCALFDCLDKVEREQDGGRNLLFDGFSDVKCRQAHMPNGLFFHPEKGIITLFDTYEFTIDENNADDADVALDPELLGKVFENLLGAFNPETSETARKSTGSFYTPREIVDYMVEESLKNYLKTKVPALTPEWLEDLFDKTKAVEKSELPFNDSIAGAVREALYTCKILDPACGSGAFPMGILHCMVRLFGRLDPNNYDLNDRLIARYNRETALPSDPYETTAEREERLASLKVQLTEGQHYPDYARKLYLIENCIYGVDIQPIATQISKLRFFISLLCDQLRSNWNENRENHGLLSLPNLEAKFVCANTLIALPDTEGELALHSANIPRLREQLQENRHQIFTARTYLKKNKLKAKDLEIRDKIREAVRATLAKPDKKLIAIQREVIEKLKLDRKAYEKPKMVKVARPVQTSLFDEPEQSELKYEMVDANQAKRDEIDTQIHFAQKKIDSEMDKSKAANVTAIDQLATMVAGWDPYDQNATSPFFDAKWMFNVEDGFDVVIGNPPYVQLQTNGGKLGELYKNQNYETYFRMGDIYCLFYERAIKLGHDKSLVAFITPNTWMLSISFGPLRKYIQTKTLWYKALIPNNKIFEAVVDTVVVFLNVLFDNEHTKSRMCEIFAFNEGVIEHKYTVPFSKFDGSTINIGTHPKIAVIAERLITENLPLSEKFYVRNGVKPFAKGRGNPPQTAKTLKEKPYVKDGVKPGEKWSPLMRGSLMGRYVNKWNNNYWILYGTCLAEPRDPEIFKAKEKIIVRQTGDSIVATILGANIICRDNLHVCVPKNGSVEKYILGILNSTLIDFVYSYINPEKGEALAQVKKRFVEQLPLPKIKNKSLEDEIGFLVETILSTKKIDADADTSLLEAEIDQLVYKLYGLTEEEIAVVEGRGAEQAEVKSVKPSRRVAQPTTKVAPVVTDDEELE